LNLQDVTAYGLRAYAKEKLEDYSGAIGDYSLAIEVV
jgi:hypothetical protein